MKIALSGTHNVGKTSLAYSLVGALKEKGVHAVVGSETVRMCPLPTGTETSNSVDAETWIMGKQFIDEIEFEKKYPVVVCDRSMLCIYAYFLWNLEREPAMKGKPGVNIVDHMFKNWISTYDYIFKLPISTQTKLSDDGFRSTAKDWQKEIEEIIDRIIEENNIKTFVILLESNDKRVQKIMDIIGPKLPEMILPEDCVLSPDF